MLTRRVYKVYKMTATIMVNMHVYLYLLTVVLTQTPPSPLSKIPRVNSSASSYRFSQILLHLSLMEAWDTSVLWHIFLLKIMKLNTVWLLLDRYFFPCTTFIRMFTIYFISKFYSFLKFWPVITFWTWSIMCFHLI